MFNSVGFLLVQKSNELVQQYNVFKCVCSETVFKLVICHPFACQIKPLWVQLTAAAAGGGIEVTSVINLGGLRAQDLREIEGNTPRRGVALVHGGQRPITLEYQINPPTYHN